MSRNQQKKIIPRVYLFAAAAVGWLLLISSLHFWLNFDHSRTRTVTMGYMPVITNLAAPLLDYASRDRHDIRFKALKFNSFAEMAEALRQDKIEAAFIIAPLAVVLHQQNKDIKVVYIGNRHESSLVARKGLHVKNLRDLIGKTVAVPIRFSGHNLCLLKMMEQQGLGDRINIVELNPPDMASSLATGSLDAYFVGEPFAAQTLKQGKSDLVFPVEDVWDSFICNLLIVKQQLIEEEPEAVRMLVEGAIRSGFWAQEHPLQAAKIAARYWNQPLDLVEYALTEPAGRIVYDRYLPEKKELQEITDLMVRFKMLRSNDISGIIDDRFAGQVRREHVKNLNDIFQP